MAGFGLGITQLDKTTISVEKAVGKPLELKLGEIVKAEVVNVFADGGVSLKIKGSYLTAKTEVPLLKDSTVFFKVLSPSGTETGGKDLKLQFKGYADQSEASLDQNAARLLQAETVQDLVRDLAGMISNGDKAAMSEFPAFAEKLMKALPAEPELLPKELRLELQDLLKNSLSATGQSIRGRIEGLLEQLEARLTEGSIPESLAKNLLVGIEKLNPENLKQALENTGVALEARLKSVLVKELSEQADQNQKSALETIAAESDLSGSKASEQALVARSDLKAGLMQLKALLSEKTDEALEKAGASAGGASAKEGPKESLPVKDLLQTVDGILKDINTFQLLSKATDSFYTFLPVLWKEMREGDIAFKRGRSPGGGKSYYCMMNLDFESMGSLGIMVMMQGQEFFASFKASDPALRSALEANAHELQAIFENNGLHLKSINVLGHEDRSLAPFERLENLESVLNIRV